MRFLYVYDDNHGKNVTKQYYLDYYEYFEINIDFCAQHHLN